jgi:hypothetical protein
VDRPLWREDGSVIYSYNCFLAFPEQSLWGPGPAELRPYFAVSFETPQSGGPGHRTYVPQVHGGPLYPRALSSCFRRL